MTTTGPTPPPAASAAEAPKKEPSIMDAMKRARELATAMVLVLTFLHSMYASYFKQEKVAEAGYKQTSETIEGYSRVVRDEIDSLKERIQVLEEDLAKAKEEKAEQATKVRPKNGNGKPKPPIVKIEGVQIEGHPVGFPIAANLPDNPAGLSELIHVDTDGIPDVEVAPQQGEGLDPLIVNMPERPWEQQSKK